MERFTVYKGLDWTAERINEYKYTVWDCQTQQHLLTFDDLRKAHTFVRKMNEAQEVVYGSNRPLKIS